MAVEENSDAMLKRVFVITTVGSAMFIGTVFIFIL